MKNVIFFFTLTMSSVSFSQVPNWTETTCDGTEYSMHTELENGNAVILDFGSMWCIPCNSTAPELQMVWENYGEGSMGVMVFDFLIENYSGSPADCSNLESWETNHSLTYPGFSNANVAGIYAQYDALYGTGSVPLILMFVPNTNDPSQSTLVYSYPDDLNELDELGELLSGILGDNSYWGLGVDENETEANSDVTLVKIVDMLGRETEYKPNTLLLYMYSDGTTEKVFVAE